MATVVEWWPMADAKPTPKPVGLRRDTRIVRLSRPLHKRARLSSDDPWNLNQIAPSVIRPPDYESYWREFDLDRATLDQVSPAQLLEIMANLSPEISRAIWDFTTMFNPGHRVRVYEREGDNVESAAGQAFIDAFLDRIAERHGSFSVIIERLVMAGYLRGAFCAELVLGEDGVTPLDIATPDPLTIRFRRMTDPVLGTIWEPGQQAGGTWISLDRPAFRYIALQPMPGSPYGRSLATPSLFPALFLLMLFHDLRRVIAQQGYPRIDLTIDLEKIRAAYSQIDDADEFSRLVNDIVEEVATAYENLEPDDAYIHPDYVTVNMAVGAIDGSSIRGAASIIDALDRLCMYALKLTPLMMGQTAGISEANANRQWEMWVGGVKSLQDRCSELLESIFGTALRAAGIPGRVAVEFDELRVSERLRDEQAFQLKLSNADYAERLGFMSRDEAAEHALGHPAAGPRLADSAPTTDGQQIDPLSPNDPVAGTELVDPNLRGDSARAVREPLVPTAGAGFTPLPDRVHLDPYDIRKAQELFDSLLPEYRGLLDALPEEPA